MRSMFKLMTRQPAKLEPCHERQRALKRARLQLLLRDIAEPTGGRPSAPASSGSAGQ